MLTLFQTPPMFGLPNSSPFCLKLEAFLRWQNIPFKVENGLPFEGPFKKVPFVDYQGQRLGDSTAIIEQLMTDNDIRYSDALDLNSGHAFQRMVEEHLYWAMVYFRWMDDDAWPLLRSAFFGKIPFFVRPFIVRSAHKQARQALYGHGIGRLSSEMIIARARQDLAALSSRVSEHKFICGSEFTHFDLSVWAVLNQLINCELTIRLTNVALEFEPLKAYLDRVNSELAIDWQPLGTKALQPSPAV